MKTFLPVIILVFCYAPLRSQEDSLRIVTVEGVEVRAVRIATPPLEQPFSVVTYQAGPLQDSRQQLSLQEYLTQVPGLFSLNANNYAQDLRIAIRGFGARSAFGIRGVKIVVDGIPETTPDGQGQIDNLNIGLIQRLEVLKGPSSALYGNAAGGVIQIQTRSDFDDNFLEAGLTLGSFNMQQYQLGGGWKNRDTRLILQATHTRSDGYREHSGLENTNINARLFHDFSKHSKLSFQFNYTDSPLGNDPGGINQETVADDRRQAREQNVLFRAGEAIAHLKAGASYDYEWESGKALHLYAFYSNRAFEGRIPLAADGWINLDRNYFGQGGHFKLEGNISKWENTLQAGYEWAVQNDERMRFANQEGVQGELVLDQVERFSTLGLYALDQLSSGRWLVSFGLRYDLNLLQAEDRFLSDGEQSGMRNLSAVNPSIGLNYELARHLHLYGSYRSSFETPSLSELSADPAGGGGFNEDLRSQRAFNYELGVKGLIGNKADFDLTLFHIDTQNDLVPYELESAPGRTFYRNAGETARDGIECWLRYRFGPALSVTGSYTYSDFRYVEYQLGEDDFAGNQLPAIPPNLANIQLAYETEEGFNFRIQHRYTAAFFATDANSEMAMEPAYHLLDLSLAYHLNWKESRLTPFFGINNLLDTRYSDNVRINAFGGRYYEPAAGINFYGGLRWKLMGRSTDRP